jgi:glutamyl/glutaminyl-tRNA synthetase
MREKPLGKLYELANRFWPTTAKNHDEKYKKKVLGLVQERLKYFAELPYLTNFFFQDLPVNPELIASHKQLKKLPREELKQLLDKTEAALNKSDFTLKDLTERLNGLLEETKQKPVVLFSLIRIATTQASSSPGLAETLEIIGKKTALKRIAKQLEEL